MNNTYAYLEKIMGLCISWNLFHYKCIPTEMMRSMVILLNMYFTGPVFVGSTMPIILKKYFSIHTWHKKSLTLKLCNTLMTKLLYLSTFSFFSSFYSPSIYFKKYMSRATFIRFNIFNCFLK